MLKIKEMDPGTTLENQMDGQGGPVVLVNVFTVAPEDEEALLRAWTEDAAFMKRQPGYISTQLHKGVGRSTTYLNYAVWESVEQFRNAFFQPEFQRHLEQYPDSAVASPHLFSKLAVAGHCVA